MKSTGKGKPFPVFVFRRHVGADDPVRPAGRTHKIARPGESVKSAPIAVGAGFYPARAGCTIKITQRTATTQYVRRGRCPHRPGRMQSQNRTHHRRPAQPPTGAYRCIGAFNFVMLYRAGGVEPRPYGSVGNAIKTRRCAVRPCLSVAFGDSSPRGRAKKGCKSSRFPFGNRELACFFTLRRRAAGRCGGRA